MKGVLSEDGNDGMCYVKDVKADGGNGNDDKTKVEPDKPEEEESGGAGTFWAVFLTLLFLGGFGVGGWFYGR